ncbi:hypothetical protein SNE40_009633 [Patella caerulea]|uniref:Uncharacterized protein n=1 Tax=Patella caerulea TaxID=87958 RepID=A0AAN8JTU2_PATCE
MDVEDSDSIINSFIDGESLNEIVERAVKSAVKDMKDGLVKLISDRLISITDRVTEVELTQNNNGPANKS